MGLAHLPASQSELQGELAPVLSAPRHLDPRADQARLSRNQVPLEAAAVRFVKALGHEQRKGLADQLGGRVSEHAFGRPVEEEEVSVTVGGHDAVADRFRQHAEVLLSLPELLL